MPWVAQLVLICAAVVPHHAHRQHRGECDHLFTYVHLCLLCFCQLLQPLIIQSLLFVVL
jgi:hypothetical protein